MTEKIEVNGEDRHPIYAELVTRPNEKGYVTDIEWNFEKFLLDGSGEIVARFRAGVLPTTRGCCRPSSRSSESQPSPGRTRPDS